MSTLWQFGKDYVWRAFGRDPITVTIPPVAAFTETAQNLTVTFNASASAGYGVGIVKYTWNFGDDQTATTTNPVYTYNYTRALPNETVTFSVTLVVTDARGQTAKVTQGVTVTAAAGNVPPTAVISGSVGADKLTLTANGTGSIDPDGTIATYDWDFGDGTAHATSGAVTHTYASGGTWKVTLTVTDNKGSTGTQTANFTTTAPNKAPTASFSSQLGADKVTVTFNASTSVDADGTITAYAWNFGDGTTGSGQTVSHTYAASGPFNVSLVVTDNAGANSAPVTAQVFPVVSSGGGGGGTTGAIYTQGSMTQGIPGTVQVYTLSQLGVSSSETNMQTIVNAFNAKGFTGLIQLPGNGWVGNIPSFGMSNQGINAPARLQGLLGDISGGTLNTRIQMASNVMTSAQITASTTGSGSTTIFGYQCAQNVTQYIAGINWVGADQQAASDGTTGSGKVSPVRWGGFQWYRAGANSIFQNCLLQGWGRANATSPPGEIGAWNEAHTTGLIFRRVEQDGMLPGKTGSDPWGEGWRRSGGIQWNNAAGFLMEDVYSHDAWTSGVTISFTSTPTTSSQSHDYTIRRLQTKNNSGHGSSTVTGQNSGAFRPLNLEFNYGTNHIRQPHFSSPAWSGGDYSHIKMWISTTNFAGGAYYADPNTQTYVYQPKWDDANPLDNGCFSIYLGSTSNNASYKKPIVYLTGAADSTANPATPYYCRVGTQVPSNITTANNYYVLKYT